MRRVVFVPASRYRFRVLGAVSTMITITTAQDDEQQPEPTHAQHSLPRQAKVRRLWTVDRPKQRARPGPI
jgi:hypothetical protein